VGQSPGAAAGGAAHLGGFSFTNRGWLRIRPRMTYKPDGGVVRARLVISPTIPRLAWPAILARICRMLRLVDSASASISLTIRFGTAGRPRCFPRASAALMPATAFTHLISWQD